MPSQAHFYSHYTLQRIGTYSSRQCPFPCRIWIPSNIVSSVQLEAGSCLHVDYQLVGQVQLEVGYHLDRKSVDGHLLCTLVPNSTHVGSWLSADIPLPAGHYQPLYFNAVFLSLQERPSVSLDSVKLLNENCSRVTFKGKSFNCVLETRQS